MGNVQKYNQQLIPCTNPQQVLTESKESLESFIKVYGECGGKVNDTTIRLIKKSIDKNRYKVQEIEQAVIECFENEQFFNWANISKHIDADKNLFDKRAIMRKKRREHASRN